MADFFEQVSFEVELPSAEAAEQVRALYDRISALIEEGDERQEHWPEGFGDWATRDYGYTGARVEVDGKKLWISDDAGTINLECVADFLQHVVTTYLPDGYIAFEWAAWCTKPALGAFGGGAVLVTAEAVEFRHTGTIADGLISAWKARCPAREATHG